MNNTTCWNVLEKYKYVFFFNLYHSLGGENSPFMYWQVCLLYSEYHYFNFNPGMDK